MQRLETWGLKNLMDCLGKISIDFNLFALNGLEIFFGSHIRYLVTKR
mgnify:CR=1 FL=1